MRDTINAALDSATLALRPIPPNACGVYVFEFPVKQRVVFLPAEEIGGGPAGHFRLLAALVIRAQQEPGQVERNQGERLLAALLSGIELSLPTAFLFLGSGPTVCRIERRRTVEKPRNRARQSPGRSARIALTQSPVKSLSFG
jgi:hypothetical protein